jgi:uncharacterized protein (TIGR03067 family)
MHVLAFSGIGFLTVVASLPAEDFKKSEGVWRIVSITDDGIKLPEASVGRMTVTIIGNVYTVRVADKVVERGTFVLDPSRNPKTIDATVTQGEDKGKTALGIYTLEDNIRQVCLAAPGKERPTKFESTKGSKCGFFITRRESKDEASKLDLELMQGEWQMQSMERDGKKVPDQLVKTYKRTVKRNQYTVTWKEEGQNQFLNTVITVDATQNPKAVDVLLLSGPFIGKKRLGIYKIEGDTETVCLAQPGKDRPSRFDSKQGALHVWIRVKH